MNNLSFSHDQELCKMIKSSNNGVLYAICIDNYTSLLLNKNQDLIEETIIKLQKSIIEETDSSSYRYCYDSFFIVKNNIKKGEVKYFLKKIIDIITRFGVEHSFLPIQLYANIGYVFFDKKYIPEQTINESLIALHLSKSRKIGYCNYEEENYSIDKIYMQMVQASCLHNAILNNDIQLAFQPIVNNTGDAEYFESLSRIVLKDGSIVSAGNFINATERFGLAETVDKIVFELVIKELKENKDIKFSVNISAYSIENQDWLNFCKKILKDKSIASRLVIEITETSIQNNYAQISNFINTVKALGCKIAIDDFGTGYTSIKQLTSFDIDFIKIDGSFIKNIVLSEKDRKLVEIIIKIAHNLDIKVIAEYVENVEIANILIGMKVDFMQGNYFSPALSYRSWLK